MLDKHRWIGYFQRFIDDGYVAVFIDNAMFLYAAQRAIVIKVQLYANEQKLKAGIIQFDVD